MKRTTALILTLLLVLGTIPAQALSEPSLPDAEELSTQARLELPVLFENGQWADVLGDITVQTPGLTSEWAYENGMIRLTNGVPTSRDVEFRFVFDNLLDIRGYDAVIMELEQAPTSWFRSMLRFRIDEDTKNWDSSSHSNIIRMTGGVDRQRLRGVGALPNFGDTVRIKKIYLEGDGIISTQNAINIPYIMDILPPRTGNTPVKAITSSGQYTGTVEWSPDHAVFEADTEYTATITLAPKIGWTLTGVSANYFRIYNPAGSGSGATGTGYGTTHAAGSGVITKTFPKTKAPLPYPDPTQFIALSFDDVYLTDTEALVDALDKYGIKGTFFANGINIEKAKTNLNKKRALDKLIAGGHEFGNHAYQHERYTNSADENVTRENFSKNQAVILELTGQTPRWSRIPYASQGTMSLRVVGEFGLTNLRGFATNDWDLQYSSSWLVYTMLSQTGNNAVRDGQIYVCHDQIGQTNTTQAIPEYYHELRSRGVGFKTISDLRAHRDFTATPGVNYANFFQNSSQTGTITINTQPAAPAEKQVEGKINGNLSVAATGTSLSYQWYVTTTVMDPVWVPVAEATNATFALPEDLSEGTYYFYCKVNASNAPSKTSDVVAVAVQGPPPTVPVLFENGQWAEALGEITVQTPRSIHGDYMWAYENGMIRLMNDVSGAITTNGQNSIPFRWQFQNTIDIRGYSAVVFELDEVPAQPFLRQLRFRIDEDSTQSGALTSTTVRMTSFTDAQRLRGVGALPSNGDVVRIKKVYLEGTGVLAAPANINRREIRDVIPPRTGNVPVREIVTSPQYTGTVAWSPDHEVFEANTVYTATINLTPREGWTLAGVAANWFQLFTPKGTGTSAATGSGTVHAAGSGVITKTFPETTPVLPYPDPTQFVVLSFDDTISPETNDLLDVLDSLGIRANFFTIGMNLEKSNRFPEYARVVSRLKNDGHEPGNHTWQHERWTRATQAVRLADWTANNNYMIELFGKAPTWIRFPYNDQNASAVSDASALNLANLWGFDTNDWDIQHSASYLINRFLTQTSASNMARDGQIYVDHDHYDNQNSTRWALPEIAHYFRSMGIDFMTASELSKRNNFTIVPGTTYNNFFLPSRITIGTQPVGDTKVIEGLISGSLTVEATVTPAAAPSYQWFFRDDAAEGWTAIASGTGPVLELPKNLTAGTYYFYAAASAPNAASVTSNVVTVVCDRVNLKLRTNPVTYMGSDAEYTLSLAKAKNVLAVELEFEIDGNMLAGKDILGLSDFEPMNSVLWVNAGNGKWRGTVTLALPAAHTTGLTSEAPVDIATFIYTSKEYGNATMALTGARAVDAFGDTTKYLAAAIGEGTATTIIARSKYDLNRDGVIDALDLGIMLLYCGFKASDPEWGTMVKVNDAWGNPVTASQCDVNNNGVIDMLDLIDLFINYTK
ncbi:MAG: polysaccharide deacetylase family protein [Clostridiales bacterium]|nr:polysaccharide deacetylase family protein [Clostridiales bacterium]